MSVISRIGVLFLLVSIFASGNSWAQYVEEVTITAQKTAEDQQTVPVAVTNFTGEALVASSVKDVFDLQNIAPGLRVGQNQSATTSNFNIRGVGTSASNFGLESSVGLYVDGVWRSRPSSMINNMVDVESVQILRGPQGTLFGKNTPSGAILFQSRKPSHESSGFIDVGLGTYGLFNASAAFGGSLVEDTLAFRLTGFTGSRDGVVDDIALGEETINDRDRYGLRGQLLYTPTDDLSVLIIADQSEVDEVCCAAITVVDSFFQNGVVNPAPGPDSLIAALGGTTTLGENFDDYKMSLSHLPLSQNEDRGVSVEVNYDTENHTWTSISAWREFDTLDIVDADFTNLDIYGRHEAATQSSFSQEFRLASNGGDPYRYILGAYYFTQDLDNDSTISTGSAMNNFILGGSPDLTALLGGLAQASADPGTFGLIPAPNPAPFGSVSSATNQMRQDHESKAVFAQFEWDLGESLTLTAGLRYTEEEKKLLGLFTETAEGDDIDLDATGCVLDPGIPYEVCAAFGLVPPTSDPFQQLLVLADLARPFSETSWGLYLPGLDIIAPRPDIDETITDENMTGTLKLTWQVNDNFMTYASYGTGYKSGGTNTDRINAAFDPLFNAETATSFEVGFKADFPDQRVRLNVALHKTAVEDFQSNAFQGAGFNLQNAGELDTSGAELEFWWSPVEGLDFSAAYVRSNADFESFEQANCWIAYSFHTEIPDPGLVEGEGFCDRSGDRVSFNPEDFFLATASKRIQISDSIEMTLRGEFTYVGDQIMDANNDPYKLQDSYSLINLNVGFEYDGSTQVNIWGRNITDERFSNVIFDVPLMDGRLNGYPGEPATYGINFRHNF